MGPATPITASYLPISWRCHTQPGLAFWMALGLIAALPQVTRAENVAL